MKAPDSVWQFIERRRVLVTLGVVIGLASAILLWGAIENAYLDYWYYPKGKSADPGLYIYPELRYTIFDAVLSLWCIDGLIFSLMSFRSARYGNTSTLARRTLSLYFALLAVLLLGGISMIVVRSHGY